MSQSEPCSRRSYTPSSVISGTGKVEDKDREFWLDLQLAKKDFEKTKDRLKTPQSKNEKSDAALLA
jgi:hypothetical protein